MKTAPQILEEEGYYMQIEIRKAEPQDAPRVLELLGDIARLHHEGRPDIFSGEKPKYTTDDLCEKFKNPSEYILVAVDKTGTVQGYAMGILQEKDDPFYAQRPFRTLYIDDLCVAKEARGQGLGKALMQKAAEAAKALGCYHLDLNVWACNKNAIAFYEAIGMQKERQYMEWIL